jgi:hypothetical protein
MVQSSFKSVDSSVNSMEYDVDETERCVTLVNQDCSYLKKSAGDYDWKFWKWQK